VFLRVVAQASWPRIALLTACGVGLISSISWLMVLNFPSGVLQDISICRGRCGEDPGGGVHAEAGEQRDLAIWSQSRLARTMPAG